jgi:hypothetical protein
MGNLPALLPNAIFRFGLVKFIVIVSNNYSKVIDKMGFTIEDKALIIINDSFLIDFSRGRQPIKRLCIASIHIRTIKLRQTFR